MGFDCICLAEDMDQCRARSEPSAPIKGDESLDQLSDYFSRSLLLRGIS